MSRHTAKSANSIKPVAPSAPAADSPLIRPAARAPLSETLAAELQMSPRSGERLQRHVDEDGNDFVLSSADGQLAVRLRLSRRRVPLSRTELRLLAALLEDEGKHVQRCVIIARVWPDSALTTAERENALAVYVCALRKRLSAVGLSSALQTVRGIGYQFVL
jgi:DNA-binding response OmpR family regulator